MRTLQNALFQLMPHKAGNEIARVAARLLRTKKAFLASLECHRVQSHTCITRAMQAWRRERNRPNGNGC